jgi:hypothetical protein
MSANGYYNGFSPADRQGTLAAVKAAEAAGIIPVPTVCSVCGKEPTTGLQRHSENYCRPLDAYPICRGCHVRVHARFRHPDAWRAFINSLDPAGWVQSLTVDHRSLTRPFDETYPRDLPSRFEPGEKVT